MNDWSVIGHDAAVRRMQAALANGQMAQAVLIVGPRAVGKSAFAHALVRALLGTDERTRRLVDAGRHPDLLSLQADADKETVGIEPARLWLKSLMLAPVEGRWRVGIIGDECPPTDEAQNAILKTLEQPPRAVVMVLVARSVDALLPTIVSRCQVIALRPAPFDEVRAALQHRGASEDAAARIARLARGRVGWALRAFEDGALLEDRSARIADLERLLHGGAAERFAYADKLSKKKDKAARAEEAPLRAALEEWLLFWRDVAAGFGSTTANQFRNADRRDLLDAIRRRISLQDTRRLLQLHTRTIRNIERNANARLSLDVLLMNLPRL